MNNIVEQTTVATATTAAIAIGSMSLIEDGAIAHHAAAEFVPKMTFHVLQGKKGTLNRTFHMKGGDTLYDMNLHFLVHETRAYLERKAPCEFVVASFENPKLAMVALREGLEAFGEGKKRFKGKVLTGWIKAGVGVTFLVTPDGVEAKLKDFGVRTMLRSQNDIGKFMKYLKRLCAMYRFHVFGTNQVFGEDLSGKYLTYEMNGKTFKVRYSSRLPVGYTIEGCSWVTPEFANAHFGPHPDRGDKWRQGDGARITFTCNDFMWKGHIMVWPIKKVAASFFDCKTIIGTDDVFVGLMGALHPGAMRMNIQPVVNFGLEKFMVEYGTDAMIKLMDAINEPNRGMDKFQAMYGKKMDQIVSADDNDGLTAGQLENWRFMHGIREGFEYSEEPWMIRDDVRSFFEDICNFTNGQVPVPEKDGFRAYYFLEPWCLTDEGRFDIRRSRMAVETLYSPRLKPGVKGVTWRDPQTRYEYVFFTSAAPASRDLRVDKGTVIVASGVDMHELAKLTKRSVVDLTAMPIDQFYDLMDLVSAHTELEFWAMVFAQVQGGGDFDDCGNMYVRKEIVEHFENNLPVYPERIEKTKSKAAPVKEWFEDNIFEKRHNVRVLTFGLAQLADKIQAVIDSTSGVGQIVNYQLVSIDKSFHKDSNVRELEELVAANPDNEHYARALEAEKAFVAGSEKNVSSDLEGSIDRLVMNGAKGEDVNLVHVGKQISGFWTNCYAVQFWATIGGSMGTGRIPSKCLENKPVILRTDPVSKAILRLLELKEQVTDHANQLQWKKLRFAPQVIRDYPCTDEVLKAVKAGEIAWKKELKALSESGDRESKEGYKSFLKICTGHWAALDRKGEEFTSMYLAELERRVHTGPRLEAPEWEGRPVGVKDAYLNNPRFFPLRVKLYKKLGLTKTLHAVRLYEDTALAATGNNSAPITVIDGMVLTNYAGYESEVIGFDSAIPDGYYTMTDGLIRIPGQASA